MQKHHATASFRIARANMTLKDIFHERPVPTVGSWVWAYGNVMGMQQRRGKDDNGSIFRSKPSLDRTGPFKVLRVDLSEWDSDGKHVGD